MPRRGGPQQDADDITEASSEASVLTPEQRAVEFLRRAMRSETHWRPSMAMAKCLAVAQAKLMLTNGKDDVTNLVWTTVVVLIYCATQLADLHDAWYELADAATAWLYEQPHFVENREDLVDSACGLLNVRDTSTILTTVFPEPKDPETLALEAALGDWKICYLDQPPYSMYYWNEKTNLSTWRNPLETAQLKKEELEKKRQRQELLAKVLPMRVKINRDKLVIPPTPNCDACSRRRPQKLTGVANDIQPAVVLCLACDSKYFCEDCCDKTHSARDKVGHIETSFRYSECFGLKGLPQSKTRLELPARPRTGA